MPDTNPDVNDGDHARLRVLEVGFDKLSVAVEHLSVAIAGDGLRPEVPGLSMRVDRIERNLSQIKWLASGGLISVLGTIYALLKMAEAIHGLKP